MLPVLAQIAVTESMLLGAGIGALFVTVAIVRAWSRDRVRCAAYLKNYRSECANLRQQVRELFEALQHTQEKLEEERRKHRAGGSSGTAPGGPGPTDQG